MHKKPPGFTGGAFVLTKLNGKRFAYAFCNLL
jgi:hypothetical protein